MALTPTNFSLKNQFYHDLKVFLIIRFKHFNIYKRVKKSTGR